MSTGWDIKSILNEVNFDEEKFNQQFLDHRKDKLIMHYVDILNNVLDKKRDEELSELLDGGFYVKEVIDIIDKYDKQKENLETEFRKVVDVKVVE